MSSTSFKRKSLCRAGAFWSLWGILFVVLHACRLTILCCRLVHAGAAWVANRGLECLRGTTEWAYEINQAARQRRAMTRG